MVPNRHRCTAWKPIRGACASRTAETVEQTINDLHALQLQFQGLPIHAERVQTFASRGKAVGSIPFRIAAEHGDIERSVVEQVFELGRELRTLLGPLGDRHAAQVQVVSRLGIVTRVTGLQKLEDGLLRRGPPQRIFCFRNRRLGAQHAGERNEYNQREGARRWPLARKRRPEIWVHVPSFAWNVAKWLSPAEVSSV